METTAYRIGWMCLAIVTLYHSSPAHIPIWDVTQFGPNQNLPNNYVRDIVESTDGTVYIATWGEGVWKIDPQSWQINHSNTEFVVDFVRLLPNVPKAKVKSRVILTPLHAKRLIKALSENLAKYEAQFGPVGGNDNPNLPPMSFNTPKAQA
jgi:hypothetical protein